MTFYVLEMIDQPGHYIAPIDRKGVMIFNTIKAAEAFVWKLDALVVLQVKIKPVVIPDVRFTGPPKDDMIGPYTA